MKKKKKTEKHCLCLFVNGAQSYFEITIYATELESFLTKTVSITVLGFVQKKKGFVYRFYRMSARASGVDCEMNMNKKIKEKFCELWWVRYGVIVRENVWLTLIFK